MMIYKTSSCANFTKSLNWFIAKHFNNSLHPLVFVSLEYHNGSKHRYCGFAASCLCFNAACRTTNSFQADTTNKFQKRDPCSVTDYSGLATAVSSCTNIVLNGFQVPTGKALDLSKLKDGATVTFKGKTVSYFLRVSEEC